jgi:hypothetical protein
MSEPQPKLNDWPLWRLLVELHDAERSCGADSPTVRVLARIVRERLAGVDRPAREVVSA